MFVFAIYPYFLNVQNFHFYKISFTKIKKELERIITSNTNLRSGYREDLQF